MRNNSTDPGPIFRKFTTLFFGALLGLCLIGSLSARAADAVLLSADSAFTNLGTIRFSGRNLVIKYENGDKEYFSESDVDKQTTVFKNRAFWNKKTIQEEIYATHSCIVHKFTLLGTSLGFEIDSRLSPPAKR